MNKSDQLRADCEELLDQSEALREWSASLQADCDDSRDQLKRLDRRYRAAREEAERLRRCPSIFWRLFDV
jgi:predicted nuclease with TOPRIM domain